MKKKAKKIVVEQSGHLETLKITIIFSIFDIKQSWNDKES